jgi:hypothetical protein
MCALSHLLSLSFLVGLTCAVYTAICRPSVDTEIERLPASAPHENSAAKKKTAFPVLSASLPVISSVVGGFFFLFFSILYHFCRSITTLASFMMQPVQPNPNLAGLSQAEAVILSEKVFHISQEGFFFCAPKCITHFQEDSIPHHPGEKACLDRCISKVRNGFYMAIDHKKEFEQKLRDGALPYQWMKDAASGNL